MGGKDFQESTQQVTKCYQEMPEVSPAVFRSLSHPLRGRSRTGKVLTGEVIDGRQAT